MAIGVVMGEGWMRNSGIIKEGGDKFSHRSSLSRRMG